MEQTTQQSEETELKAQARNVLSTTDSDHGTLDAVAESAMPCHVLLQYRIHGRRQEGTLGEYVK